MKIDIQILFPSERVGFSKNVQELDNLIFCGKTVEEQTEIVLSELRPYVESIIQKEENLLKEEL